MADNFGIGVSRVLDPQQSSYLNVINQEGMPVIDSEISLIGQLAEEGRRQLALRGAPSGWYGDAISPQEAFVTNPSWANWFRFGPQMAGEKQAIMWANVNGWQVPVAGTLTGFPPGSPNNVDTWNRIPLPPPPANTGDARIDFVFLEVWKALVAPNPSTVNKPSADGIYRLGNVEGGFSFLSDDLKDPDLNFETSKRIQLQYRIRVTSGLVGLSSYPDGFDPSVVKAQGVASSPTAYIFENMRKELGDPGLWRAGDGNQNALGTVDGYVYAIPLCAVFRRNSVAWDTSNLNGGVTRTPTAVDRTGYRTFSAVSTLAADITPSATTLTLTTTTGIPLPLTPATPLLLQIGDEILSYTVITGTTMSGLLRGQNGSVAEIHRAGAEIRLLAIRPDGLYSDQITQDDILDLRHVVNPGGFDYQALLQGGLDRLLRGNLRSTWKRGGGGPQGPWVAYADLISASGGPLGTTQLADTPDGIRQVWGDPALLQPVVMPFICAPTTITTIPATYVVELGASYTLEALNVSVANSFTAGDQYRVPRSQFLSSLPGSDSDQLVIPAEQIYVKIRFQGETGDLTPDQYSVSSQANGDLLITLTPSFVTTASRSTNRGFLTLHLQYGPGRGLSRRPDAVHGVYYTASTSQTLVQPQGVATGKQPLRAAYAPLWSKFRSRRFNGELPVTSEAYVDPASKTIILTPFQQQSISGPGITPFGLIGVSKASSTNPQLGAMPTLTLSGAAKWNTVDPLNCFRSHLYGTDASRVTTLPRKIVPGFGAVRVPILPQDSGSFDEGLNFMFNAPKGLTPGGTVTTYVPVVVSGGANTYGVFSTRNLSLASPTSMPYNTQGAFGSVVYAGIRFFTDPNGLGRYGLELPPFYGIARLFGVYAAEDYRVNGSPYNISTRERDASPGTKATNLLRQQYEGPVFWVTLDADGDSTFVLNAEAIDLSKAPNAFAISEFAAGHYVIEASIFGFDRGTFDLNQDARIVITREAPSASTLANPTLILPGAPSVGEEILVSYSRAVDQSDPWGSQTIGSDVNYTPGPMVTATRYQLMSTSLAYANLARPNQKPLEVLAGMAFQTTLGTGRLSGDVPTNNDDFRNVGYEPWAVPVTPIDPRPTITPTALAASERFLTVGTEYLGCIDRLPLGALWRTSNFRGNAIGGTFGDPRQLVTGVWSSPATISSTTAPVGNTPFVTAPVQGASMASGHSGEMVVHVDGATGNYGILTTYRTARGGSAYTISGIAGGDIGAVLPYSQASSTAGGILSGLAMLVRNNPTSVGATESSAGQELMLLVVTTSRPMSASGTMNTVQLGTAGTGEGYSACSIYRLPGHPLVSDSARPTIDPASVTLARPSTLG